MVIGLFDDIKHEQPADVRILGLDIGKKTIGLAVFEPITQMITPLKTVRRTKFTRDIKHLDTVIKDYDIGGYVVGLPLSDDGSENPACQRIRDFIGELKAYPNIIGKNPWVAFVDEHLSTDTVDYIVDETWDISKGKAKAKGITDSLAAVEILRRILVF